MGIVSCFDDVVDIDHVMFTCPTRADINVGESALHGDRVGYICQSVTQKVPVKI